MSENAPFAGLLVLELASVLAGPSVGQFFAELGATVVKLENSCTSGDVTRRWKLASENQETDISAYFSCANWGKESVAADLRHPEVLKLVHELAAKADIVIASYKPGDAEKLQVDYKTLSALNQKLVYGHITGYGTAENRAGYDAVIQAESGLMFLNGPPESGPTKLPVAFVDLLAAHQLKEGLLTALYLRERTGKGRMVEISLLDAALTSLANQGTNWLVAGHDPQRAGSEHPNIVPYGTVFKTSDNKELILAVGDDRQFKALCQVLDAPEIASDARFIQNSGRVKHRTALIAQLRMLICKRRLNNLLHDLHNCYVPAGAIRSVSEALSTSAAAALKLNDTANHISGLKTVAFRMEKLPLNQNLAAPPHLGQHTKKVLKEFTSVSDQALDELEKQGVIWGQPAIFIK